MVEATERKRRKTSIGVWIASRAIRFYQVAISPMLGPRCRFYPTCSSYALEAIKTHGLLKGSWMSVCRICKCHPFHPGGVDFVPPAKEELEKRPVNDAA